MIAHQLALDTALAALPRLLLQSDGDGVVPLVLFFGVGLLLVYGGFRKWQRMRLMQDTPTETVRSAAVGRTELKGAARPIDEEGTIEQPFTDGECLVATYKVEEWEEDHDDDDHGSDGSWNTIDSGTLVTPFEVDDGTGRMRVEPEEDATYEISEEHRTRFRVGAGRRPPDEVVEFFERRYDDDDDDGLLGGLLSGGPSARDSDRRRYTQEVLPPGEDVYLLGGTEPRADAGGSNAERLVFGRDAASEEFIVSDMTEEELVSNYRWVAPGMIVGGLALSTAMLYFLLA